MKDNKLSRVGDLNFTATPWHNFLIGSIHFGTVKKCNSFGNFIRKEQGKPLAIVAKSSSCTDHGCHN